MGATVNNQANNEHQLLRFTGYCFAERCSISGLACQLGVTCSFSSPAGDGAEGSDDPRARVLLADVSGLAAG